MERLGATTRYEVQRESRTKVQRESRQTRSDRVFGFGESGTQILGLGSQRRPTSSAPTQSYSQSEMETRLCLEFEEKLARQQTELTAKYEQQQAELAAKYEQQQAELRAQVELSLQPRLQAQITAQVQAAMAAAWMQPLSPYFVSTQHLQTPHVGSSGQHSDPDSTVRQNLAEDFADQLFGTPPTGFSPPPPPE